MSETTGAVKAYLLEKRKNDKLLELIVEYEEFLTKEIEWNKNLTGNNYRHEGFVMGLESAKSMFLVRIWQEVERLYDSK
ncbi:hypothetical protein ACFYKT_16580 [Cytobacillus sp. FJAT-53684]|uniref:Uncharacterized protein n=1 Tax=Cytobacillus mangrovibacter TaxID=3299024 RepID=A0ABW6K2J5_9BACI